MSSDRPRRGRGVPVSWGRSQRLSRDDLRRPGRSLETNAEEARGSNERSEIRPVTMMRSNPGSQSINEVQKNNQEMRTTEPFVDKRGTRIIQRTLPDAEEARGSKERSVIKPVTLLKPKTGSQSINEVQKNIQDMRPIDKVVDKRGTRGVIKRTPPDAEEARGSNERSVVTPITLLRPMTRSQSISEVQKNNQDMRPIDKVVDKRGTRGVIQRTPPDVVQGQDFLFPSVLDSDGTNKRPTVPGKKSQHAVESGFGSTNSPTGSPGYEGKYSSPSFQSKIFGVVDARNPPLPVSKAETHRLNIKKPEPINPMIRQNRQEDDYSTSYLSSLNIPNPIIGPNSPDILATITDVSTPSPPIFEVANHGQHSFSPIQLQSAIGTIPTVSSPSPIFEVANHGQPTYTPLQLQSAIEMIPTVLTPPPPGFVPIVQPHLEHGIMNTYQFLNQIQRSDPYVGLSLYVAQIKATGAFSADDLHSLASHIIHRNQTICTNSQVSTPPPPGSGGANFVPGGVIPVQSVVETLPSRMRSTQQIGRGQGAERVLSPIVTMQHDNLGQHVDEDMGLPRPTQPRQHDKGGQHIDRGQHVDRDMGLPSPSQPRQQKRGECTDHGQLINREQHPYEQVLRYVAVLPSELQIYIAYKLIEEAETMKGNVGQNVVPLIVPPVVQYFQPSLEQGYLPAFIPQPFYAHSQIQGGQEVGPSMTLPTNIHTPQQPESRFEVCGSISTKTLPPKDNAVRRPMMQSGMQQSLQGAIQNEIQQTSPVNFQGSIAQSIPGLIQGPIQSIMQGVIPTLLQSLIPPTLQGTMQPTLLAPMPSAPQGPVPSTLRGQGPMPPTLLGREPTPPTQQEPAEGLLAQGSLYGVSQQSSAMHIPFARGQTYSRPTKEMIEEQSNRSKLSASAREFVPKSCEPVDPQAELYKHFERCATQVLQSESSFSYSDSNNLDNFLKFGGAPMKPAQIEHNEWSDTEMVEILSLYHYEVCKNPGVYEVFMKDLLPVFKQWLQSDETSGNLVDYLFDLSIASPSFVYISAKMCQDISVMLPKNVFRQKLILRCHAYYSSLQQQGILENDGNLLCGFVLFLAELYVQMRYPQGHRLLEFAEPLIYCLNEMLKSRKPTLVDTFIKAIKLAGVYLDKDKLSQMNSLMAQAASAIESLSALKYNVVPLKALIQRRNNNWEYKIPSASKSTLADGAYCTERSNTTEIKNKLTKRGGVRYGPDGQIITAEEESFLETQVSPTLEQSNSDDGNDYDGNESMDEEMQEAFEQFLRMVPDDK